MKLMREKAVGPLGKQVFFKNVFPRDVLHQGHQLLVFKQRISRADRHRACESSSCSNISALANSLWFSKPQASFHDRPPRRPPTPRRPHPRDGRPHRNAL